MILSVTFTTKMKINVSFLKKKQQPRILLAIRSMEPILLSATQKVI